MEISLNRPIDELLQTDMEEIGSSVIVAVDEYREACIDIPILNTKNPTKQNEAIKNYKNKAYDGLSDGVPAKYSFPCPYKYIGKDGKQKLARAKDFGPGIAGKSKEYDEHVEQAKDNPGYEGTIEATTHFKKRVAKYVPFNPFRGSKLPTTPNIKIRFEDTEIKDSNIFVFVEGSVDIGIICKKNNESIDIEQSIPLFYFIDKETEIGKFRAGTCKNKYVFGIPGEFECQRSTNGINGISEYQSIDGINFNDILNNGIYTITSTETIDYSQKYEFWEVVDGIDIKMFNFDRNQVGNLVKGCIIASLTAFEKDLDKNMWLGNGGDEEAFEAVLCGNAAFKLTSIDLSKIEAVVGAQQPEYELFQNFKGKTISDGGDIN